MTDAAALSLPAPGAPPAAWVGHVLDGRYKLRDLIGEGGMGAVFTAEQLRLSTLVAVKIIHSEHVGNEEVAERFRREALAMTKIDHPNVARALDSGALPGGGAYLVTQLVRGPSLTETIAAGKMPWPKVCELGAQIADALTAAHAAGIVHRDLKPDNILLEPREDGSVVKVLDFGIARLAEPGPGVTPLTRLGTVMGTPGYMAPEQAMGEPTDHRTDLYALGVILWECLAGRELWDGGEMSDLLTRQLTQKPPSLAGEIHDLPPELEHLIQQLLAREATQRPQTAREVRDALRTLARGTVPSTTLNPPSSPPKTAIPQPTTSNKGLQGFLAVFGAMALLIVVLWAIQHSGGDEPAADRPAEFVPAGGAKAGDKSEGTGPSAPVPPDIDVSELPAALRQPAKALFEGEGGARTKAAKAIVSYEPEVEVPLWLRSVALLEQADGCEAKHAAVKRLAETNDKRGLFSLQRLDAAPKDGCKGKDCLECLRPTLARSIEKLSALP